MITPRLRTPSPDQALQRPTLPSEGAVLVTLVDGSAYTLLENSDERDLLERILSTVKSMIQAHDGTVPRPDGRRARCVRFMAWHKDFTDGVEVSSRNDLCTRVGCITAAIFQAERRVKSPQENRTIPGTSITIEAPDDVFFYQVKGWIFCRAEELELARMRAPDGHD